MAELKALLFDVDGTLADTERDGHRVAFNAAFRDAGLDWDWSVETYGELLTVTGGKERIRYYIDNYNPDFNVDGDLSEFIAGLHKSKTGFYLQLLREGKIPLRPGVARLLDEAREAGYVLGIATTTTPENVTILLEATLGAESIDWFSVIAAGDIVPAKKPAPDIFTYALEQLNLPAEACMAFEDSGNGIKSSVGAGLKTIVTVNEYTADHDFSDAVLVLDQMGEPENPATVIKGDLNGENCLTIQAVEQAFNSAS